MGKPIYDDIDKNGEKIMTKNDFVGLDCSCMEKTSPSECGHSGVWRDKKTGEFFSDLI